MMRMKIFKFFSLQINKLYFLWSLEFVRNFRIKFTKTEFAFSNKKFTNSRYLSLEKKFSFSTSFPFKVQHENYPEYVA